MSSKDVVSSRKNYLTAELYMDLQQILLFSRLVHRAMQSLQPNESSPARFVDPRCIQNDFCTAEDPGLKI
jgi:hypothetical protein